MEFPVFKTKIPGVTQKFDLVDPAQRRQYFQAKAGKEIKKIQDYLANGNTFIAYLLGKKNSGKGTYTKLFMEAVGSEHIAHISVGDIVRGVDQEMREEKTKKELVDYLKKNYRGFLSLKEIMKAQEERSTAKLLPSEFILALVRREIDRQDKKALFIDGLTRELDQISYSLFFRNLVDYRDDPDFFVLISIPESVIDERIKYRVICPKCQTSRNVKLLATKEVRFDAKTGEFYLICDHPDCKDVRMVAKEGDELGIEAVRGRLDKDDQLIKRAFSLHGIPKVVLRNAVPISQAQEKVDDYEITPEYVYQWDEKAKKVKTTEKPWTIKDDAGVSSCSLLAPPVAISLIKQIADLI